MKSFMPVLRVFLLVICLFCVQAAALAATAINSDGYYKGIRLAGNIRVQVVQCFPDLRVKTVDSFPDDIGEWQFVGYGEDFTIQFVDSFPDIRIQFVDSFPGVE